MSKVAAVSKYTEQGCFKAWLLNERQGEGPYTIATQFDIPNVTTVQAANAAIDAGRALVHEHGESALRLKYAGV